MCLWCAFSQCEFVAALQDGESDSSVPLTDSYTRLAGGGRLLGGAVGFRFGPRLGESRGELMTALVALAAQAGTAADRPFRDMLLVRHQLENDQAPAIADPVVGQFDDAR